MYNLSHCCVLTDKNQATYRLWFLKEKWMQLTYQMGPLADTANANRPQYIKREGHAVRNARREAGNLSCNSPTAW